jgi:hypothetical protein
MTLPSSSHSPPRVMVPITSREWVWEAVMNCFAVLIQHRRPAAARAAKPVASSGKRNMVGAGGASSSSVVVSVSGMVVRRSTG